MLCLYRWLPALTLAASLHAQITEPWPTRPLGLPSATTQGALIPWPDGLSTEATPIFEADGVSIASGSAEVIQIKGKPFLSATFETSNCLKTVYSLSAIDPVTGITFAGTGELTVGFLAVDRDVIQVEVGQSATIMVDRFFDSLELKTDCSAEEVADFVLAPDSNSITVTGRIPNRVTCRILPQVRSRETAEAKFIHIRVVEKTTTACTEDVNYVAQVASAAGDATLLRDAGIAPGVELDCETDFSMAFTYLVCNGGSQGMSFILEQDGCIYRMSGHIGDDIRLRSELTIDGSTVTGSGILDLIMSPNGPPQAEFTFEGTRKLDDDDARGTVDIEVFVTTIPARGGAVRATVYARGRAPIVLELDGEPDWVEAVDDSDPVFVPAIRPEQSAQGGPILRGSGVILFRAEPNPNTASREASFTIAGHPLTITQLGTSSTTPSILPEGAVNGATFRPGITSNGWATISGDFFLDGARVWGGDDFVAGQLPTELDDVSVMIGGKPAFVQFTNGNQINVLPDAGLEGIAELLVTTPGGGPGIPSQVRVLPVLPEFFRFSPLDQRYIAAVHLDGVFVGPTDLFGGAVPMRPAKPGDVIQVFGTGWGETSPPVDPGMLVMQQAPLEETPVILIDGEPATVWFGGLVGSGLYQFNVIVPEIADGDAFVEGEIQGVRLSKRAFLRVESGS